MRFPKPPDEGYAVGWTKDNEVFHGYNPGQIAAAAAQAATGIDPTNEFPWLSRGAPLPIPPNVATNSPLLLSDNYRNLLIFQNNSFATSPDIAPNLYIAVDGPVQLVSFTNPVSMAISSYPFNAITLVPGEGVLLDTRVLTNAIYVAWGASTNTDGTLFTNGMLIYGRTPNSPPFQVEQNTSGGIVSESGVGNAGVSGSGQAHQNVKPTFMAGAPGFGRLGRFRR